MVTGTTEGARYLGINFEIIIFLFSLHNFLWSGKKKRGGNKSREHSYTSTSLIFIQIAAEKITPSDIDITKNNISITSGAQMSMTIHAITITADIIVPTVAVIIMSVVFISIIIISPISVFLTAKRELLCVYVRLECPLIKY